jgi:glycosyltransferase involved in cell wall biosynthesis
LISAIIPARNEEASIVRAVESIASQPEIGEVIVVNDGSTDCTGAILSELKGRIPKLKILAASDPPRGWTGKNHAISIGTAAANGAWLLFTDADTNHLTGSARRALADAIDHNAALVSYSPEQELGRFWERALVPIVYWRLSKRYCFERVNDENSREAAANGQYILMRREVYESVGGHQAIAEEILEDVALSRLVKNAGHRIFFASGQGIVQTRMYRSLGAMWEGWTKNLYPLFGGSPGALFSEVDDASPWFGVLLACVAGFDAIGSRAAHGILAIVAALLILRPIASFQAWLRRNRYPWLYIQYYLPGIFLYSAALLASWWKSTHGVVVWKGREYLVRS